MTRLQKLQLRQSELRTEMGGILDKDAAERTDDDKTKLDGLTKEARALEGDIQAALLIEDEPKADPTGDPQKRELADLEARSSVLPYMVEAATGRPVTGAEQEYRAGVLGDDVSPGVLPIDLLAEPEPEHRQDAATTVDASALADGSQATVLQRVFTRSIASRLMVSMPMVPVGAANYPILSSGHTPAMRAPGEEHDATAAVFSGFTLEPKRLTGRYLFRIEDAAKLRSYESVLRRDLAAAMSDAMDAQVITGDGTGNNVNGFLSELDAPTAPTAPTTWNEYLAAFTGEVDGINAYELMDLRSVIGKATFGYVETLFRTGATDNGPRASACEYTKSRTGGQVVSSRIPAADGTTKSQLGIIAKTSYPGRNAVAPIWRGMELVRDQYTGAAKGEVSVTMHALWNFKVLRETGWALFQTRVAA